MRILSIGDVVADPGIKIVERLLPDIRKKYAIDFCITNGENSALGLGITGSIAQRLYKSGVNCITLGNHVWAKRDIFSWIADDKRMVRPANGGKNWPGQGYAVFEFKGVRLVVINLMGLVFMDTSLSPFDYLADRLELIKSQTGARIVILDFHAEATSEKYAMFRYLDGKISLLFGTHTHVQTADEQISKLGTGYISDLGMTGSVEGVIGMSTRAALKRFVSHLPERYEADKGKARLSGIITDIDLETGHCLSIERVNFLDGVSI